jgi:hypothetical protein
MKRIEDKYLLREIERFSKSSESIFMDKQFDSLCKIHNPFGYVENGKIKEIEDTNPDLIIELNWKEFCNYFGLKLDINSETSISQIQKAFAEKYKDKDYDNFYWASGSLGGKQIDLLTEIIGGHFDSDSFYCYYSMITNLHFDRTDDEILLIDFKDLLHLIDNKKGFSPTIWWNKNLDWLVYTDYDLTSSYVFSDKELIDKIIGNTDLESFGLKINDFESDFEKNILK